jgi:hypothetical protein
VRRASAERKKFFTVSFRGALKRALPPKESGDLVIGASGDWKGRNEPVSLDSTKEFIASRPKKLIWFDLAEARLRLVL